MLVSDLCPDADVMGNVRHLFLVLKAIDGPSTVPVLHSKLVISELYEYRFLDVTQYVKILVKLERLHMFMSPNIKGTLSIYIGSIFGP